MMRGKKGISPLIATVLIIGFTIVLAALVIQWGGDLFKGFQEETSKSSDIAMGCSNLLTGVDITSGEYDSNTGIISVLVDNNNPSGLDIVNTRLKVFNGLEGKMTEATGEAVPAGDAILVTKSAGDVEVKEFLGQDDPTDVAVYAFIELDTGEEMCTTELGKVKL